MKNLFLIIALSLVGNQLFAQLQSSHAIAVGTPDGVTISWDAYSDQIEIEGCFLYKKVTRYEEYELLTPELLVSSDSSFAYTDNGSFDPEYPPIYALHVQTPDSTYIIDKVYGFQDVSFEVMSDSMVVMRLTGWNTTLCCHMAKLFIEGIFIGDIMYNNPFTYPFEFPASSHPGYDIYLTFEDNDWMPDYAEFKIKGTYLKYMIDLVGDSEFEAKSETFKLFPNPAATEVSIQLPQNILPSVTVVEVYSTSGQKLMGFTPNAHLLTIETAKLPAGICLVRLFDGQQWHWQKLVIER
ncbi:MAG: T9SS type A sorting domain-containing protein [Bacteroidales bacterium]|nr:T9SS type A sorting domain-containing protein [Bacteroidales bacterium]